MIRLTHCQLSTCKCEFVLSFDYSSSGEPIESIHEVISVCDIHSWMPQFEAIQSALSENRAQNIND